ncbi:DUF7948 domain-containing protein [Paenibacillus kobensis]|uniref:DUF7948 domain-containing protein n=1 Tax=Paenibacillus kobensis TaxID=59841 RepID=UPI000FD7D745|nr:hypothetical protein [Paenibacillus kobensis]
MPEEGKFHYFRGNDTARHVVNADLYREVVYRELWPGIDVLIQGEGGELKFDWLLLPGAKPEDIGIRYAGADEIRLDADGHLHFVTPYGDLVDLPFTL